MRILLVVLGLSAADLAHAQLESCPPGNLLARRLPLRAGLDRGSLLTDGIVAKTGRHDSALATRLRSARSAVDYDLGRLLGIRALLLQGDGHVKFTISGSVDGKKFTPLWEAPLGISGGMRTRHASGLVGAARFLRLQQTGGVAGKAVSELQAFCVVPNPWPPQLTVGDGRSSRSPKHFVYWGKLAVGSFGLLIFVILLLAPTQKAKDRVFAWRSVFGLGCGLCVFSAVWGLGAAGLGLAGAAIAVWLIVLRRQKDSRETVIERGALLAIALCGAFAYSNFGTLRSNRLLHPWDLFHYYMGAKYFPENAYGGLYPCTLLAEVDNGHGHEMRHRKARDLDTNRLLAADALIAAGHRCRGHFSPERWQAFRHDVERFRRWTRVEYWERMLKDHGFNASPVWLTVGHVIANWGWRENLGPPELGRPGDPRRLSSEERQRIRALWAADEADFLERLTRLALVDVLFYVLIFSLILWAFGLRAFALAILAWGIGEPWHFNWTGGSFLRLPWLLMATAGLCLLKKGYPGLSGFALAWSMLLRVFPGALAGGLALKGLWHLVQQRRLSPHHRRLLLGAGIGLGLLLPLSLPVVGGFFAYNGFLQNSLKHKSTPLTNHIGLNTLLSWHPAYGARFTKAPEDDDPFAVWKEKRRETLSGRWPWRLVLVVGLFLVLGKVANRLEDWQALALSTSLIFGLFELTNYYYVFLILLAPLVVQQLRHLLPYLWLLIIGQGIGFAIGWADERNVVHSLLVLVFLVFLLLDYLKRKRKDGEPSRMDKSG